MPITLLRHPSKNCNHNYLDGRSPKSRQTQFDFYTFLDNVLLMGLLFGKKFLKLWKELINWHLEVRTHFCKTLHCNTCKVYLLNFAWAKFSGPSSYVIVWFLFQAGPRNFRRKEGNLGAKKFWPKLDEMISFDGCEKSYQI